MTAVTSEDREWLRTRLHPPGCRQCDIVRQLLAASDKPDPSAALMPKEPT